MPLQLPTPRKQLLLARFDSRPMLSMRDDKGMPQDFASEALGIEINCTETGHKGPDIAIKLLAPPMAPTDS